MAIDFPNTPTTNQIYTVGSRSWKWDGTIWAIYSNNPVLYRQDSPPSSPQEGDQWFETDTGRMFVYYGTAWVELGNATDVAGALQPSQVTALSAVTTLTSDDVFPLVDGPSSAVASSKITYGNLVTNMSNSLFTAWTNYTPTIKAGATTLTGTVNYAKYCQIQKTVIVQVLFTASNTGAANGAITVSYPVGLAPSPLDGRPIGNFMLIDISTGFYHGVATADTLCQGIGQGSGGNMGASQPAMTVVSGDRIGISITYEVA
jgi:hypothetical protein